MRIPDTIKKPIVFIGRSDNGPFVPYGTGFLILTAEEEDLGWQSIVTCRHVIEKVKSKNVSVRVNTNENEAKIIPTKKSDWYFHPDDRIDIAVCPSSLQRDSFDFLHVQIGPLNSEKSPSIALSSELARIHDVGIGDEVYVSGMFVSRIGEERNIPILRMGTIASMPDEPFSTNWGFHEAFLVEMRSIDGLSGSPAFLHLPLERQVPRQMLNHFYPGLKTAFLLGMVLGTDHVYGPEGLINIATTNSRKTSKNRRVNVPMNTGIAVVVPVSRILEAANQPSIVTRRNEVLQKLAEGANPRHDMGLSRELYADEVDQ